MESRPQWQHLLLIALTLAWGCAGLSPPDGGVPGGGGGEGSVAGGTGGGGSGGGDGGLPLAGACAVLTTRRCEVFERCGLIATTSAARRTCLASLTATWCGPGGWLARVDPLVNTLRYDALRAQACADSFSALPCADWEREPEPCSRFLLPNAPLGGTCYDGYSECLAGVCRGVPCHLSCQPRGQVGEPCRMVSDCRPGLYCRPSNQTPGVGLCSAPALAGNPCDSSQPCAEGLGCVGDVCGRLPGISEPCPAGVCDASGYCASVSSAFTCLPRRDAGAGCTDDAQCSKGTVCDALVGRCVPLEPELGEACGVRQQCGGADGGLVCIGLSASSPGQCQPARPAQAKCSASRDCQRHLACNPSVDGGAVCGARRPDGRACGSDRDCQAFMGCLGGLCRELPVVGGDCTLEGRCLWGPCLRHDGGAACSEPLGPGQPCSHGADCASGRCEQGTCLAACRP